MAEQDSENASTPGDADPLSGPDNAWRRMSDRENLMEITGLLFLEPPLDYEELRTLVAERIVPFPRFRQRVVERSDERPAWELDEEFDLDDHLEHVTIPGAQGETGLREYVTELTSGPLDPSKPLWQIYLVDGLEERNALVIRIHHSIGDGFALLYALYGLADDPSKVELPVGSMPAPPAHRQPGTSSATQADRSVPLTDSGPSPSVPEHVLEALRRGWRGLNVVGTALRLLRLSEEPSTSLTGELTVRKNFAWTGRIPLESIKQIGRATDATINDVLLVATAGAFREYLAGRGEALGRDLRCAMPVNLTPLEDRTATLGNALGLGFVPLPVSIADPFDRVRRVSERTGKIKQGTEAYLTHLLLRLCGRGPRPLEKFLLGLFEKKASAVVTGVPGPIESFSLAGKTVCDMLFWVPQTNGIGIGVSTFSYNGGVRVGITSDQNLVSDPQLIAERFSDEIEAMNGGL